MESVSPPPCKKLRLLNIEIPLIECRREFKLPRQYPSMAPTVKINGTVVEKTVKTAASASGMTKMIKDTAGKEISVANGLKMLRIRAQDGRDLGEVKVKILSQDNLLNAKNIVLNKSTINNTVSKPIKFSIIPPSNADKLVCSKKGTEGFTGVEKAVISSNKLLASIENGKSKVEDNSKKFIGKSIILTKVKNRPHQDNRVYDKKILVTTENGHKALHNIQCTNSSVSKYVKVQTCPPLIDMRKNNGDKLKPKDNAPAVLNKTGVLNVEKFAKDHLELAKSRFPVVKCEKLMLSKNKVNINELRKISTIVDSDKPVMFYTASMQRNQVEEQNASNNTTPCKTRFDESKECNVNTQTKLINSVMYEPNSLVQNNDLNRTKLENSTTVLPNDKTIVVETDFNNGQREDCPLTPITNKSVHNEVQNVPSVTNNKPDSSLHGKACNNEHVQSKNSNLRIVNNDINNVKEAVNSEVEQETLSQQWDIIKEALISVKDKELRTKALQALADCGIGLAKQVPIVPPEKLKTVHDSQIQTDIFGLLDLESFVLVREDKLTLERIKQTERSTVANKANLNVSVQSKTTWNNCIDNEDLYPRLSRMNSLNDINEFDRFFNECFNENTDAKMVKQILSTPHSFYKKVATQLQKDFEAIQCYDETGMLNIHRAVIELLRTGDRLLRDSLVVEREEIVLTFSQKKKENNKFSCSHVIKCMHSPNTCLELAVKFNSSTDIVNTLLQAGAKPTSTELIRESPIILASKLLSPLLPYLLQYITDRKLLNQVDSDGLAALHYCALNGNIEGVHALLEAGADVNLRDNRSGRTPFFHALEQNHVSIAQKLLAYGAVANTPNFSGQTILSVVDETKSVSLKAALKQIIS